MHSFPTGTTSRYPEEYTGDDEDPYMRYDTSASATKSTTSTIVAVWSIFSPPRRSNFPKSPEPGMIESPAHFDWSPTTMMMMMARITSTMFIYIEMRI
jgi:hypothetical protein